jgi:hypothetical protein
MTRTATPAEMAIAWQVGVMHGDPRYAEQELAKHPVKGGLADPIYQRDEHPENGGWHSASTIRSPSAIACMRRHLHNRGLVAPESTEAAWEATLERLAVRQQVADVTDRALRAYDHHVHKTGRAPVQQDYAHAVIDALHRDVLDKEDR